MRHAEIVDLFDYLYWIRDRALERSRELSSVEFLDPATVAYRDLRSTLVHELDVERSWRLRLQGEPTETWDVTLDASAYQAPGAIADDWQHEADQTRSWLTGLTDDDLAAPVTANRLEGFPLATYLVHVVMHGIESLSAAAILLHRADHSMGEVGFLDYVDATGSLAHRP